MSKVAELAIAESGLEVFYYIRCLVSASKLFLGERKEMDNPEIESLIPQIIHLEAE